MNAHLRMEHIVNSHVRAVILRSTRRRELMWEINCSVIIWHRRFSQLGVVMIDGWRRFSR